MKQKNLFALTAILGAVAVAIGALGAHGLKPFMSDYQREIFQKAVFYHFIHVIACFISLFSAQLFTKTEFLKPLYFFILGIFCFSGSLYVLALDELHNFPLYIVGPITPIGGLLFILGWGILAYYYFRYL